ncbi:MAG TPA: hypothetical protein PKB06_03035, partial [Actinotalea sp.]|nr:hypothetical protein [Actinotalea sp.]
VGQGASGGELSRLMLAVEVALATAPDADRPATFIFDEVDAGVGGRAAVEVGRRLARLSRQAQVRVVTHLAQVAAFADRHVVVTKGGGGPGRAGPVTGAPSEPARHDGDVSGEPGLVTASDVREVTGADRVAELARMLSGSTSDTALQHAAELLDQSVVGP